MRIPSASCLGLRVSSGKARASVPDLPELPDLAGSALGLPPKSKTSELQPLTTAVARDELGARENYVADSSVFPSNLGVNPQIAIIALATLCAEGLVG
jgi:hypothetical protein